MSSESLMPRAESPIAGIEVKEPADFSVNALDSNALKCYTCFGLRVIQCHRVGRRARSGKRETE